MKVEYEDTGSGIWTLRAAGLVVIISIAAILYVHARLTAPSKSSVNGTYYNKCCGEIVLRDGQLIYRGARYGYDLEKMKFGLTAFVSGDFGENGILPSSGQTAFSFYTEKGKRGLGTSAAPGRDYFFVKKD